MYPSTKRVQYEGRKLNDACCCFLGLELNSVEAAVKKLDICDFAHLCKKAALKQISHLTSTKSIANNFADDKKNLRCSISMIKPAIFSSIRKRRMEAMVGLGEGLHVSPSAENPLPPNVCAAP